MYEILLKYYNPQQVYISVRLHGLVQSEHTHITSAQIKKQNATRAPGDPSPLPVISPHKSNNCSNFWKDRLVLSVFELLNL